MKPGDALDEEAVVNAGDQVGLALRPGEERERLGADGRSALEAASDGRPGRGRAGATGGIRIVQEGLQFAVDDQGGSAGSDALAVEGARRERRRVGGIIDKGDHRVGDDVAESVGEHRAALQHRFTGEGVTDDAEELSGHPRVEHDGEPLAPRLGCPKKPSGAVSRIGGGDGRVELARVAADREPETGLGLAVGFGERVHGDVATGLAGRSGDTRRGGNRRLVRTVDVFGRLDTRDPGVGCKRRPLELDRQGDLVLGRERPDGVTPQFERRWFDAIGHGETVELVGFGERGVVAGLAEGFLQRSVVEGAGIGVALLAVDDDPDTDTLRLRSGEGLDLAFVGADLGLGLVDDERFDLLAVVGPPGNPGGDVKEFRHGSGGRTADGERRDPKRRGAVANRNTLAVLAARAG